jgi:hypothetical protein
VNSPPWALAGIGWLRPQAPASSATSAMPSGLGDRLDITGARWGLQGAQVVLKLRALHTRGDFDTYWRYQLTREH